MPFQLHLIGNMSDGIVELPKELAKVVKHHMDLPQADYYDVLGQMVRGPHGGGGVESIRIATYADSVLILDLFNLIGSHFTGLCTRWLLREYGVVYDANWIDNKGKLLQTSLLRRTLCSHGLHFIFSTRLDPHLV